MTPPPPPPQTDPRLSSPRMRDVAALLALPRAWRGREPAYVASNLLDVIVSLARLDLAYIALVTQDGRRVFEDAWPKNLGAPRAVGDAIGLHPDSLELRSTTVASPAGTAELRLLRVSQAVDAEHAVVIAGSARPDFPNEVEAFLCRIAVDQAVQAMHASRLVANLTAANAAKATFLATMSHELRTPLNAILGYADLLRAGIGGDLTDTQASHMARIDVAARHLLELIESILSFARLEAGKEQVHVEETDAVNLTHGVAALVEPLARRKGLRLSCVTPSAPVRLRTDAAKVRQILLNLLSNAVKFTAQGDVGLEVTEENGAVLWRVRDTGIGIAPADLSAIFEPFRQVGELSRQRAPGTGLGLSVSRQLTQLLRGDLAVSSEHGIGSTFTLRLPKSD